ncbi:MAG: fibronectin type III domain-containing protein [Patescibacteria group bacterium]
MKKYIYIFSISALFISAFFIPKISYAASYYVDFTSGTDSADCTDSASPCQTFGAAGFSGIAAGDTVNVIGTYDSSVGTDITVAWNGSAGNPIIIQAWEDETQPVIDGSSGFTAFAINFTGSYVTFDGFDVRGVDEDSSDAAIKLTSASNIIISNNTISATISGHNSNYGIYDDSSSDTTILGNEIYNVYANYFTSSGGDLLITRNIFYNQNYDGTAGVRVDSNSTSSLLIINNFFYDTTNGLYFNSVSGTGVYNNSFYNLTYGVYCGSASGTNYLKNNIFHQTGSSQYSIYDASGSSDYLNSLESDYNDFYYDANDVVAYWSGFSTLYYSFSEYQAVTSQDANSLDNVDPEFVSTESGSENLHLQATSQLIDAGTNLTEYFTDDVDGETRPYNVIFDIGADERPVPTEPGNLGNEDVTPTTATLTWDAPSTTVNSYTLQYDSNSDFSDPSTISGITETSYTISGLEASNIYYFKIKGTYTTSYSSHTGSYSSSSSLLTTPYTPTISNITARKATVNWENDNASSLELPEILYILEVADNLNYNNSRIIEDVSSQNYRLKNLKTSKKLFVRVKALSAEMESDWSATEDFRTLPRKGKINKIVKKDYTTISLRLKKIYRIDQYKAKIWLKKGSKWKKGKVQTKTKNLKKTTPKMKIKNLTPEKTYKIKVWGKKLKKIGPKSVAKTTKL